jgi:hypothetical protein
MGRGLGTFQKAVLDVLGAESDLLVRELALKLYGWPYTATQKANLLATLVTLQVRALVEVYDVEIATPWTHVPHDEQAVRLPSDAPRRFVPRPYSPIPTKPHAFVTLPPNVVAAYWPSLEESLQDASQEPQNAR